MTPAGPRIERNGARVLFLDSEGRMLMVRGHDPHEPERTFWFTPGGGIEPGETGRQAAVRELAEETGIPQSLLREVQARFEEARARGWGAHSSHAVLRLVEESAGVSYVSPIFQRAQETPDF